MEQKDLPEDVQEKWHNVTRRMQSIAKSDGFSIVSVKVLVEANGTPITWEVNSHILEPKSLQKALLSMIKSD